MNRNTDLQVAASGHGGYSSCPEGVPVEFALLSILAAFGVAFGILYRALTIITMGRKKRAIARENDGGETDDVGIGLKIADMLWFGETYLHYLLLAQPNST